MLLRKINFIVNNRAFLKGLGSWYMAFVMLAGGIAYLMAEGDIQQAAHPDLGTIEIWLWVWAQIVFWVTFASVLCLIFFMFIGSGNANMDTFKSEYVQFKERQITHRPNDEEPTKVHIQRTTYDSTRPDR